LFPSVNLNKRSFHIRSRSININALPTLASHGSKYSKTKPLKKPRGSGSEKRQKRKGKKESYREGIHFFLFIEWVRVAVESTHSSWILSDPQFDKQNTKLLERESVDGCVFLERETHSSLRSVVVQVLFLEVEGRFFFFLILFWLVSNAGQRLKILGGSRLTLWFEIFTVLSGCVSFSNLGKVDAVEMPPNFWIWQ